MYSEEVKYKLTLRILFTSVLFLITTIGTSQFLYKADIDFSNYLDSINYRKKKTEFSITVQKGCFNCTGKTIVDNSYKKDSLTIFSLRKIGDDFEIGVFSGYQPPVFIVIDTCSIFSFIDSNKKLLAERPVYYREEWKHRKKLKFTPPPPEIKYFQTLVINTPNFDYADKFAETIFDYNGEFIVNKPWYSPSRSIINWILNLFSTHMN